jgi:Uma2 family endonuclease
MSTAAAPQIAAHALSLEQWADLDEDRPGELVDGRLVEEEASDFDHESIVTWLVFLLYGWVAPRGGFVFPSDAKYGVTAKRGRKPDVSVCLPGTAGPPRRGVSRVPPDIMIEVISREPSDVRRDRIEKPADYAAFGVRYYWLVQPDARTLEIYELQAAGGYLRIVGASEGVIDVPGCPGLHLDLDALWTEVGRLPPAAEEAPASQRARRKVAGAAKPRKKAGRR